MDRELRTAIDRRNSAWTRARVVTLASTLIAVVLTAAFAVAAAGSTHAKRVVTHVVRVRRRLAPVVAPTPPLVSAHAAAPTPQAPPAAAPAPAAAPVQAPVVVSGGS
jgi:hypothetical protein